MDKKGQAGANILAGMILLVLIGVIGITSITVYDSVDDSLSSTLTSVSSDAGQTLGNFTDNVFEGYSLTGNVPIVLASGLLIAVILGFALVAR